jgi:long-subunit acyl-CoA synthetase (AMP-forming)
MKDLYQSLADHPDGRIRFSALDGSLLTKSHAEMYADVKQLISELSAAGLRAGDLVGLVGPNCYAWVLADLALMGLECVSVCLPTTDLPAAADASALIEKYRLSALLVTATVSGELPPEAADLSARPVELARRTVADAPPVGADVFTVVFSSGTAGTRKGLPLTWDGAHNTVRTSVTSWQVTTDDNILIVMPFSSFQQRHLFYTAVLTGCDATVVAPERMFQKMREFEPTIIIGPPSFFEIVDNQVRAASVRARLPYLVATLLHATLPRWSGRRVQARLGRRWTRLYGSRVRLMFTGSAPVPPRVVTTFRRLGMPLFEIYGSTESGYITFNLPEAHRTGAAGRPVAGVDISLGDDGEVLVRTKHPQAHGYVFDGVETAPAVFRPDGTIATGDLGRLDRSGFLHLIGRKKNVIITRSGVKISPEELEQEIENGCRVSRAVVVPLNDGGSLGCAVWLDDWESPGRTDEVQAAVDAVNAGRDPAHRIVTVVFRPAPELTPESGLLTRNLKVDRGAVSRVVFAEPVRSAR